MERKKQLNLLKEIDGCDIKLAEIPDYINVDNNRNQETKSGKKHENNLTKISKNKKKLNPIKLQIRKSKSMKLKNIPMERRISHKSNNKNIKTKKTSKM